MKDFDLIKNKYHVLGVMSGTSLDGIDLAEIEFSISEFSNWDFRIKNAQTVPYPSFWKEKLRAAVGFSETALIELNENYTHFLGETISKFIEKNSINNLDAVCSHGHTVLHRPEKGVTLQIGNLKSLAKQIKQTVVCDFRVEDVALGGQGAPLVPIGDRLLFSGYVYCLNLGGFANISFEKMGNRIAFDICPVNIVLNHFSEKLGTPFDENGNLAASGKLDLELLNKLDALPYYGEKPPKSLGLEWVHKHVFPLLGNSVISSQDVLRTFTEHIAHQLSANLPKGSRVLVTGGGAYNLFLMERLKSISKVELEIPSPRIIEFKEALVFGLLGVLKLRGEVNCLASVTGSKKDHSSGKIFTIK